jgi:hypothetical protein
MRALLGLNFLEEGVERRAKRLLLLDDDDEGADGRERGRRSRWKAEVLMMRREMMKMDDLMLPYRHHACFGCCCR